MKKLLLSLIAVVAGTMSSYAQDDLVATLSHGSNLSTYTGADALSEAYTAAAEGDIITLSPGVFNAVDIEKTITVRGAGMIPLATNSYMPTQISGNFNINLQTSSSILTLEGIQSIGKVNINGDNLAPINIYSCRFNNSVVGCGLNMNAYSCVFAQGLRAAFDGNYNSWQNTTINCMNCVIIDASSDGYTDYNDHSESEIAKIIATNCVVKISSTNVEYCKFTNCIIASENGGWYYGPLPTTSTAMNCIGINYDGRVPDLFVNLISASNTMVEGDGETAFSIVFKTLTGFPTTIAETYELTETAAATYLGDDGTQVGIYGGTNPFNPTPMNPQIKKFTVDSTTEGTTLKVKINVE